LDYFVLILINFSCNSRYHGSLTKESNFKKIQEIEASSEPLTYKLPQPKDLRVLILEVYKDISEIFVHTIDYSYIYKSNINTYVVSIWVSWSTVMSVNYDLKQYILRTLLVISLSHDGKSSIRYDLCKQKFLDLLDIIAQQVDNSRICGRIRDILVNDADKDLRIRFYNCLLISDLAHLFFIGKVEDALDNGDTNTLDEGIVDEEGSPIFYDIETNTFEGNKITSKVRFLLDQLIRSTYNSEKNIDDQLLEKTSAWLLLSLSSKN
jgi:hypothetical protein